MSFVAVSSHHFETIQSQIVMSSSSGSDEHGSQAFKGRLKAHTVPMSA
jgi:hypothetical protein